MLVMLASPLIAGVNAALDQRSGRRKYRKKLAEYEAAKATIGLRIAEAVRLVTSSLCSASPDLVNCSR